MLMLKKISTNLDFELNSLLGELIYYDGVQNYSALVWVLRMNIIYTDVQMQRDILNKEAINY